MENVFDLFKERGLIAQATDEASIRELLGKEKITFYTGFDPTADSLHVGHFMQLIIMRYMQQAGHRPIVLLGGGTTMIGDPSGRTDMRKMLTQEQIQHNADEFKKQMSKFIDFSEGKAIMANNADWLLGLNYVDFLREIGVHFSVNKMLTAECVKTRMEKGITFLEFNYMLMQSYDFLHLAREYGCKMQFGGNDQWSNIIGGVDLTRKMAGKEVYGMKEVPVWEKTTLTLEEAAAYTGIGENRLRDITNDEQNLVLWVGTKRLIKRRALEKYIDRTYSV